MIAVDTNVLVRLLVGDHPSQSRASRQLFESQDVFITDTVLLETEWVLRGVYELDAASVILAFRSVAGLSNVHFTDARLIARVLDWHEAGLDFPDAFHLALSSQATEFRTFDAKFIKSAKKLPGTPVTPA